MLHIASKNSSSSLENLQSTDVQPNAVDLRLKKVFKLFPNTFTLNNEEKHHRGSTPENLDIEGYWNLIPGSYEVILGDLVKIGDDEAGWVITRSTLNRNGVFITSGLYDSGYYGPMAACLHVTTGMFRVKQDTRVGQFLLFKAESLKQYDGSYGLNKDGTVKSEQKKFYY